MKGRASVALGVAGGYFLGRRQKIKLALVLGSVAAGFGVGGRSHALLPRRVATGPDDSSLSMSLANVPPSEEAPPDDAGEFGMRPADAAAQVRMDGVAAARRLETSETVLFSLDGHQYRLDLSLEDAARLRDSLAPFVAVARPRRRKGRTRRGSSRNHG